MSARQPTEHEWRLVAKVMEWECVEYIDFVANDQCGKCVIIENQFLMIRGGRNFRPLHDHNDLARLVEAMQAAGWTFRITHYPKRGVITPNSWVKISKDTVFREQGGPTDLVATFWACVEALVAEEKRDARTD
jgi:hypothetical protein